MAKKIHPTALVDARAELADGVEIGPYAVIEAGVVIGEPLCRRSAGWRGQPRSARQSLESHCAIGGPPQDLKYNGEPLGSRSATATRFASS